MADIISKIKLPDNVTYDIKDTVSGYTTNTGTVTGVKVNGTTKSPSSGVVDIGTVATSDTKNTAGSTDTSSKIFIVGATSQAANPQTYSQDTAYVGTDGCLYSDSKKVVVTDDSRLSDSRTPTSHTHGNIQNGGTLQTNDITIASGDKLVVTDSSNSSKVARASVSFDGSTTTKCLTQKGTWESFSNNTGTVTSVKVGTTSYSPSSGVVSLPAYPTTLPASDTTSTYSSTGTAPVNGTAVAAALATLPAPMVFKGTVGTGGTVTVLPVNGTATIGDTYKVITAGTYASQAAKVGDVFTCLTKTSSANTWAYIPSGDETDSDTWRNIKVNGTEKIGSGISTGAVDFVNGTNTTVSFNATGNKVSINATDTNTHRPIQVNGTQILGDNTTALNLKAGDNVSLSSSSGTVTIAATDTTYESKAAVSGGTDVSLVTTGEKYEWDNADTKVDQKLESTSTSSYPLLMSSDTYTDTENIHYTGDVLRNNSIYANPSSGAITALGWITSGDGTANTARLIRASNENGYAGVMAGSSGSQTESLLGVMTKGANESEGNYMIWRAALGTSALLTTPATYIGGYNYINEWENFIVQGRSGHYWGVIPAIQSSNGIMEIGKHIDFHTSSGSTSDNDYRITCTGSGAATYSGTWSKSSSRKIKENIEDMDLDEAKEIFKLRPVKFDYKEGFGQKDQRGLIAEEVAEVLPKLVIPESGTEGEEDWAPASVDYIGVVPYLIKIVQEQQKEIDELKRRVGV